MSNNIQAQGEPKRDKRYNVVGVIIDFTVRQTQKGEDWVTFKLDRSGANKKTLNCVAFSEKALARLGSFNEGSLVKLFGFFEPCSFTRNDGQEVTYQRFRVLWAGPYEPKKSEGAPAAASATAQAPTQATLFEAAA